MLEKNLRVLFHGEGDSIRGTGHLVRSLGMAADLCKLAPQEWLVEFFTNNKSFADRLLLEWKLFNVSAPEVFKINSAEQANWTNQQKILSISNLIAIPKIAKKEFLVTDGKYLFTEEDLRQLYRRFDRLFFIDNVSVLEHKVDGVIFPNDFTDLKSTQSSILTGSKWQWLNPGLDFVRMPAKYRFDYSIFMGGGDPNNLTKTALDDIQLKSGGNVSKVLVLIGALYQFRESLNKDKNLYPKIDFDIRQASGNFLELLCEAETCLVAFGLSSIELEYLGKKVVLYTHNTTHLEDANRYLKNTSRTSVLREAWQSNAVLSAQLKKSRPEVGRMLKELFEKY